MTGYNLMPGVNLKDLPGCRPEDILWEKESDIFCEECEVGEGCNGDISLCRKAHEFEKYFEDILFNKKEYYEE